MEEGFDIDTGRAAEWLQNNRLIFQDNVYLPVMFEMSINDDEVKEYLVKNIWYKDLWSFLFVNPNDFNKFVNRMRSDLNLRVNAQIVTDDRNIDLNDYPWMVSIHGPAILKKFIIKCIQRNSAPQH